MHDRSLYKLRLYATTKIAKSALCTRVYVAVVLAIVSVYIRAFQASPAR